ncbi:MAG: DNA polymerase III subunit gamma/tau [Flavobacteriales bacterium]|nr:DNA polymerase III subunit gamma/tau [Flavobacteriales bacterium]
MENFVVSARKYRPTTFDSVVGQQSITNTLKNAIKTNHLAQAFLFCGSRGVGKTTCARILAKTINCSNRTDNVEACNECDSCKSFNDGRSMNIYELDAASNNSVDNIRELTDQVRFAPQIGKYKVYIIDEVHMLSSAAFNAFLKTLEEPPAHAIFILATTEKHKIIPTILSRCQIFDFNRIKVDDIAQHLLGIAQKEGIDAEEEALHIIAQKAEGALRDALSIFDQIVSFSGDKMTYQNVIDNLNILDYDYYFKATDFILANEIADLLLLFDDILNRGFDGHLFINGLASHFRNLLVCLDGKTVNLLEVGKSVKEKYFEQAKKTDLSFLMQALDICRQCDTQYKSSKSQRLLVELSLMQLASITANDLQTVEKKKPSIIPPPPFKEGNEEKTTSTPKKKVETSVDKTLTSSQSKVEVNESAPVPTNESSNQTNSETSSNGKALSRAEKLAKLKEKKAKTSTLSIQQLTQEEKAKQQAEAQEAFTSDLREPFTQEQFNEVWSGLAQRIKKSNEEGNTIIYSAMIGRPAELKEDFKIHLLVDNKSQAEELNIKKTDIHNYLRKKLRNGAIELEVEIIKNPKLRKAYTAEEKFNELAEENPALLDLRRALDLEFL